MNLDDSVFFGAEQDVAKVCARHMQFWDMSADKPLIGRIPSVNWRPKPYPLKGGISVVEPEKIQPAQMDIERLLGTDRKEFALFTGDLINPVMPLYPTSWLEAVIGCPICVSAFGCVAQPAEQDLSRAALELTVETAMKSPWIHPMDEVLRQGEAFALGRAPVTQIHLRGVIDLLAAFLGEDRLCLEIYDHPAEIRAFAETLSSLIITVVRRGLALRRKWFGGHVSCWGIFSIEPLIDYQIDASGLFSARKYAELFLEYDQKVLREFPLSLLHLHSAGLHILDVMLALDEVSLIELSIDREAGNFDKEKLLWCCRKIQSRGKRLLLWGWLEESELAEFTTALRPQGLAVSYWNVELRDGKIKNYLGDCRTLASPKPPVS
ncbi:MAG: hypothetical protein HY360_03145 [Verrucomicrobia bacterium]|nr:hypothetical protein [Verrucomicrobiota bacterium]